MSDVKKLFAVIFAVMAVMLMSTAVFAATTEYNLAVGGKTVTSKNAKDILGNGAFSYDANTNTLTVKGDYTYAGNVISGSIEGLKINVVGNPTLTCTGVATASDWGDPIAIWLDKETTITGDGTLTLKTTNRGYMCVYTTSSLYINNTNIIIDTKAARGIVGSDKGTLSINNSNIEIKRGDTFVADTPAAVAGFERLELIDCKVSEPVNGILKNAQIFDSTGTAVAEDAKIIRSSGDNSASIYTTYKIRIGDTIVTSENAEDILGDNAVEYNAANNTLYIYKDIDVSKTINESIYNGIDDLTIKIENDCTITGDLYLGSDTSITGNGKLTLNGFLSDNGNGRTYTFNNATVNIVGKNYGIYDDCSSGNTKFIFNNSDVTLSGGTQAIYTKNGIVAFTLNDSDFSPANGYKIINGNIYESDGVTLANKVVIVHKKEIAKLYDLYIAGTQVTEDNANDILGNGVFSYDDGTSTLYINKSYTYTPSSAHTPLIENNGVKYLTIKVPSDAVFTVNGCLNTFKIGSATTITGAGKLTVTSKWSGKTRSAVIYAPAKLTIKDANMVITGQDIAIHAYQSPLEIIDSRIKAKNNNSSYSAIYSDGASITVSGSGEIFKPQKAVVKENIYNGTTIYESDGTTVANEIYIGQYAVIAFNENGGSGTMESINVPKDENFVLPDCTFTAPTNTGFYKWRINGKLYSAGEEVEISDNTVLYATWYVKEVRKRVTAPVAGATPVHTMTDDTITVNGEPVKFEDYTTVQYSNYGNELGALLSEPFKMKTQYNFVAYLSLNNDNSYYYSENTHYYINGEEASLDTINSGIKYAIINYTFPPMKYQQLVFDKEKSKFEVGGTLHFDTEIFESIFNEISAGSDEAINAVFEDGYWEYKWYADDKLVYTSKNTDDNTYTVSYDCSGKTIYAVLKVGDQTAKSEEVSIPVYYKKGDIDHDGYVTDKDATLLLKYISGTYTLTENQKSAAKATDSTKAEPDMLDVVWILNNKTHT